MVYILNIETSTKNCSVCLSKNNILLSLVEEASENYSHGEQLHVFIEQAIDKAGISLKDIDAIAVGKGPGSYTGLRIGVSAAKGLCFSLDKPLISISSLAILAQSVQLDKGFIVPTIDARRMEVYSAVYNQDYELERKVKAEIIDENSLAQYFLKDQVYLVGDGAKKCESVLDHNNLTIIEQYPSAKHMIDLAYNKYKISDIEDVAYFEPYYLKDFVVTPQKK